MAKSPRSLHSEKKISLVPLSSDNDKSPKDLTITYAERTAGAVDGNNGYRSENLAPSNGVRSVGAQTGSTYEATVQRGEHAVGIWTRALANVRDTLAQQNIPSDMPPSITDAYVAEKIIGPATVSSELKVDYEHIGRVVGGNDPSELPVLWNIINTYGGLDAIDPTGSPFNLQHAAGRRKGAAGRGEAYSMLHAEQTTPSEEDLLAEIVAAEEDEIISEWREFGNNLASELAAGESFQLVGPHNRYEVILTNTNEVIETGVIPRVDTQRYVPLETK